MLSVYWHVLRRDLLLAMRRRADLAATLAFFVLVCALFPFGVGPEAGLLRTIAPGVLWVAALLASTLALNRLFVHDHADGTLEQLALSGTSLAVIVLGKVAAHWLVAGLPLVLLAPLLALQFGLAPEQAVPLGLSLLLGTPVLSLIGALGAALTLGARGGGILLSLLVLPLSVPVLIFGVGAAAGDGGEAAAASLLLGGLLGGALALGPWASAAALRIALE
jgi:heme exporter protein B